MRDMCGSTDCADGTPVYENGRCQCSDGGSVLTAAGGSKLGDLVKGFDPPTPLTFSEVRFGTRPPPGQGPSPGGPPPGSPGVRPPR
jgi:hypothetical protein